MRKGFSLIQTLIVIGFIGVLTIAAYVLFDPVGIIQKAMDNKRKSDLALIQKVLQQYYKDFGRFPPNPGDCLRDSSQCRMVRLDGTTANWGDDFNPYIKILPQDPSKNKTYIYYVKSDGQSYYIYANLDREDKEACNKGRGCLSLSFNGFRDDQVCGGICNYAVSSGNVTP